MEDKKVAVFGIYPGVDDAERAVDTLVRERFANNDISVLLPDNQSSKAFAHEKNTKAPEGTATGAATGGTIGGALGLLAGIGVGGAVGGLVGALVGMGIPEYEARRYESQVKDGGVLLSVHCATSDDITRAKDVLKRTGANDISSAGEKRSESEPYATTSTDRRPS